MGEFAGRAALVTGAASGIGLACARALAAAGARVALADRDAGGARRAAAALQAVHGRTSALAVGMDVTRETSVRRGVRAALRALGGLDTVVSNAGVAHAAPIHRLTLADWNNSLAVNATGHFLVARESLKVLLARKRGGAYVFVGTKNVASPGAQFAAYSASKAAEVQFARVLALEGGPHGIRVNTVHPDAIFAGSKLWTRSVLAGRAKAHRVSLAQLPGFYAARTLLRRTVLAEDVAEAVLFLLSPRAAKITGAQLTIDAGVPAGFYR